MRSCQIFVCCGLIAISGVSWTRAKPLGQESKETATKIEIDRLISRLGSNDYRAREEATRVLLTLEEKAVPALQKAVLSEDTEIRRRAEIILRQISSQLQERELLELYRGALSHGVDYFIDWVLAKGHVITEEDWSAPSTILKAIVKKTISRDGTGFRWQPPDFLKYPAFVADNLEWENPLLRLSKRRFAAGSITASRGADFFDVNMICSGSVRGGNDIRNCFIVANDNILMGRQQIIDSVAISSGDIIPPAVIKNSVIVARGNIKLVGTVSDSVVVAGGSIPSLEEFRAPPRKKNSIIKEREPQPLLGLIKFFDPARQGVEVTAAEDGLRVTKVDDGKPFAKAGFRVGDIIVSIDDIKTASPDEFRVALRRKAVEGRAQFSLRREDKILSVPVTFPVVRRT